VSVVMKFEQNDLYQGTPSGVPQTAKRFTALAAAVPEAKSGG
jgi:hypothetical protein